MDIIMTALQNTLELQGDTHFTRPAGSSLVGVDCTNGLDVAKWLETLDWAEVTDIAEELGVRFGMCRYFRATIPPDVTGFEGVALLEELDDEELTRVRVARGHHGNLELQLPNLKLRTTEMVHIILGNDREFPHGDVTLDTAVVVTWYPGRLTRQVSLGGATVKWVS